METPFPQGFIHVADVEAASLHQAVSLTTSDTDTDGWKPKLWIENGGVQPRVRLSLLRDTDTGDVIVDPRGRAHRYDGQGFGEIEATAGQSLPSPGAIADERDEMPTPEEWRKLKAEWTNDYGLRRMEDRGVRYEDEAERPLDRIERQLREMKQEPEIHLESTRHYVEPIPGDVESIYDTCDVLGSWHTLNDSERFAALHELNWQGVSTKDKERIIGREMMPVPSPGDIAEGRDAPEAPWQGPDRGRGR